MSQAEIITTTTRRNTLRLGVAAVAATILAPGFAAPSRVSRLHGELVAACREQELLSAEGDSLPPGVSAASLAHQDRMDAACDRWRAVAHQLPAAPASTAAELRQKVDMLRIVLESVVCIEVGQTIDDLEDEGEIEHKLAWSLALDVLRFVGTA